MGAFAAELAQQATEFNTAELPTNEGSYTPAFGPGKAVAHITAARVQKAPWEDTRVFLYVEMLNPSNDRSEDNYIPLTQLKDGQVGFTKKQLIGLGWTGPLEDLEDNTDQIVGNEVEIFVKESEYDGKKRTNYYYNKVIGKISAGAPAGTEEIW